MSEQFTDEANAIVSASHEHADALANNYVGTEHLVLALLDAERAAGGGPLTEAGATYDATVGHIREYQRAGTEADALRAIGVDPTAVQTTVRERLGVDVRITGLATSTPGGTRPVTPRTRTVLELAATRAGGDAVTPRHLLLGLLDEDGGLGVIALDRQGVNLDELRRALA